MKDCDGHLHAGVRTTLFTVLLLTCTVSQALASGSHASAPDGFLAELWRVFTFRDYNTRVVVAGTTLLGLAAGLIGTFLVLRKRALLSDTLSHATLPGIALAFILMTLLTGDGKQLPALIIGAALFSVIGTGSVLAIQRLSRLKDDAALGIVLSVYFGLGIALMGMATRRKDQLNADRLVFEGGGRGGSVPYTAGIYRSVKRQARNNIIYLANLLALMVWYRQVRRLFVGPSFPEPLYQGLVATLNTAIDERIHRFVAFCKKLQPSIDRYKQQMGASASVALIGQKEELYARRNQFADMAATRLEALEERGSQEFLSIIQKSMGPSPGRYIEAIHALTPEQAALGSNWLQQVVDTTVRDMIDLFPSLQ